jgi:hypothetical protein
MQKYLLMYHLILRMTGNKHLILPFAKEKHLYINLGFLITYVCKKARIAICQWSYHSWNFLNLGHGMSTASNTYLINLY